MPLHGLLNRSYLGTIEYWLYVDSPSILDLKRDIFLPNNLDRCVGQYSSPAGKCFPLNAWEPMHWPCWLLLSWPKKGQLGPLLQIISNWVTLTLLLNPKVGPTFTSPGSAFVFYWDPDTPAWCGFKGDAGFGEPVKYLLISFLHLKRPNRGSV